MPLPEFIIIGSGKAGTSTVHETLKAHPQIGMSQFKEPNYFTKNFDKGIKWYRSLFAEKVKKNGEASPSYTVMPNYVGTAKRISETIPNAKLIYILRDPIDRIISHLHHNLYRDRLNPRRIEKVVLEDPQYVNASKYFYQISDYLKFFDQSDILFLQMEELKTDLNKFLNRICYFIDVEPYDFSERITVSNRSSQRYLIKNYDKAHSVLPRKVVKFYHLFFYTLNIKIERPELESKTLVKLKSRLCEDVESLKGLTGKEFTDWETYNKIELT